jgi:hypothetical protein
MRQALRWVGIHESSILHRCHFRHGSRQTAPFKLTHTLLALRDMAAGWTRWLELPLPARDEWIADRAWPVCLMLVGNILLWYREA